MINARGKNKRVTIKTDLADSITPQSRPIDVLITDLYKHHLLKTFDMVVTRFNMQLVDLNSKPCGGQSLRDIIDFSIGA